MSSTLLVKNCDNSYSPESESFNSVKQEIIESVRKEPMLRESIQNDFYNEESKYNIDRIIDRNGKVWPEEDLLTTWNSHSINIEASDDFYGENNSTAHLFPKLDVYNRLNEIKVEEIKEDLIRDKNHHMKNEYTECYMSKIEELSEKHSSIELEQTHETCVLLTSMDSVHSAKTEKSENVNTIEENKFIINQIIDENGKVWPKEDFLTAWNFHSIKIEKNEHFNRNTECTKSIKKDVSEMFTSVQKEQNPPKCDFPSNADSIHSKLQKHRSHPCPLCDYNSSWREALRMHIKSVHSKPKNHKRHLSGNSSSQKRHLQQNNKSIHLQLKNYKCNFCDYITSHKGHLQQHVKSVHLKLKSYNCNSCDYSSSFKSALQRHIKSVHLNLRNHKCHLCDYSSLQKGVLQGHMRSVHLKLKSHKCHLCDYSSSRKGDLRRHIESIHLKLRTHKCDLCDYGSSVKSALQSHIKSFH